MNIARLNHRLRKSNLSLPNKVIKRDGSQASFDISRIQKAIENCYRDLQTMGVIPSTPVNVITESCAIAIASKHAWAKDEGRPYPSVEQIQDLVEITLLTHGQVDAARAYMSYRDTHAKLRGESVPDHVREAFDIDAGYFPTPMQRFTFYDKYSRFNWELGRRETWPETVDRTIEHLKWEVRYHLAERAGYDTEKLVELDEAGMEKIQPNMPISDEIWAQLREGILLMKVMPSMRLLAMAGPAARRNSVSIYNCSFLPICDIQSFVEIMIISMSGCGVGYSVERQFVEEFARVQRQRGETPIRHVVEDSSEGWAAALRTGLESWWAGSDVEYDYGLVRPAGAVLRTKGGRASGPGPLREMLDSIRTLVLAKQGGFADTDDAHLIACWTGEAAVQGATRRTAMIALFDWFDQKMRTIKNGAFWNDPMRKVLGNANNSTVWPEDITELDIMNQMTEMMFGCAGEPGIFSRHAALNTMPERRAVNNKDTLLGVNPCGEIVLRPYQFCNLSQAISRYGDTEEQLREKVGLASILGTIQSLSTRFPGLRPEWKINCEEERLLGVDLTAQNDCELLWESNPDGDQLRQRLKAHAIEVNQQYAELLGINPSAAITCNKPAGNSTTFINSSGSGIGRAHAECYVRNMTVGAHTPQFRVLREAGVPLRPYAGFTPENADRWWASFPVKAPKGVPLLRDASAVDQCEFWLLNKLNWTEHNPSFTVKYRMHEVVDLVKWVADHKDVIGGISFLPISDVVYPIMPFEEITEDKYNQLIAEFPDVDYSLLYMYERSDMSEASTTLACFAGQCEL